MSSRLQEKVCVITGTGGSMSRAGALTCAREFASVVGCDLGVEKARDTGQLVRGSVGDMASKHTCHLADPTDCRALVELALGSCALVDALFNLHPAADVRENIADEGA